MTQETPAPGIEPGAAPLTEAERKAYEEILFAMMPKKTYRQIGARLNRSAERIRQIEAQALRKLLAGLRKIERDPPWRD